MNTTPKRLRILGDDEIAILYERPRFTHEERMEYFTLSWEEKTVLEQLRSTKSRLHFILQLGYFKARHLFFAFDLPAVREDALYIQEQYFPSFHLTDIDITKVTRLRQQRLILELYNYRNCRAKERQQLETRAQQAARVDSQPIYVFRSLTHYLRAQRLISPAYSVMQDIVGKALNSEQARLTATLHHSLEESDIGSLKVLLEDAKGLYEITLLKREPRDFSRREIAREIERGHQLRNLYELAKTLLPCLHISSESIKYYASLVTYYSVFRLKQLDEWLVYLYLLCFIDHRYQKLHDNLLNTLIYHVRRYLNEAKSKAKERVYNQRLEGNENSTLPIFKHYNIDDAIHSSSDGQKFETRTSTINARHSPKYFGLKKGVVAYTLNANHVPINAELIGPNEHESHYVFDLLFNNTTDIQPEIHSTDTHGTNEVNFALLHCFGYQFAPRYRDIYGKVAKVLYGFKHPSQYDENWMLKPVRQLNPNLIISEWENIQRILVSLALKTTTQSIIVGKLSAYTRKNKTRQALWEYDNIIRSLYLLDYIDSPPLRRNVQRALNRGESYHQLSRAVSYANYGKLRFKTEYEQQLWKECSRLVTNCIIYYNAMILSKLLIYKESMGELRQATLLKQVSPVAWQHINLHGRYEFKKLARSIDIDEIVLKLSQLPITQTFIV